MYIHCTYTILSIRVFPFQGSTLACYAASLRGASMQELSNGSLDDAVFRLSSEPRENQDG